MNNKVKMKKVFVNLIFIFLFSIYLFSIVSAGVGVRWNQETALLPENSKVCLTYGIYNPWPTDSYVKVQLSDSLQPIVESQENVVDSVPKYTYSNSSLPVHFCFQTPKVYKKDCLLFDQFLCKQDCSEPLKVYEGEVQVMEVSEASVASGGSGGSTTAMSVSAPLRVRVQCIKHGTDYNLLYIILGIIALGILLWRVYKRKKKKSGK